MIWTTTGNQWLDSKIRDIMNFNSELDSGACMHSPLTNDEIAALAQSIRVHGKGTMKYDNVRVGLNSRLDTIQAAVLNVKLTAFIEHELEDVNRIYKFYAIFQDEKFIRHNKLGYF